MKLFIFDMGGVLLRDYDIVPEAASKLGISAEKLRSYIAPFSEEMSSGLISTRAIWKKVEKESGLSIAEDYFATLFNPKQDKATYLVVEALSKFGKVVCGTNTVAPHYDLLKKRGDFDCFKKVYPSHLMFCSKPDSKFWEYILDKEHVSAKDAFFTDDSIENVEAAKKLGFNTHLYTSASNLVKCLKEEYGIAL